MLSEDRVAFFADGFAVLDPIEPGYSVRLPTASTLTARADETEPHALTYTNEQARVVVEDSDRIDPDVMEHTRQSRLQAWQEQRP